MPPSGDMWADEQSGSGAPPPTRPVTSAMIIKLGAAARDSQSAIPAATAGPDLIGPPCPWASVLLIFVMTAPPRSTLVAALRRAIEPLIRAPQAVEAAGIGRIGVIDDAVL